MDAVLIVVGIQAASIVAIPVQRPRRIRVERDLCEREAGVCRAVRSGTGLAA
jgi:hypothetical protein